MRYFKMDTCWNKAHFFAQAKIEVGDSFNIKTESFNYSARRMKGRDNVNGKHWVQGKLKQDRVVILQMVNQKNHHILIW